MTIKKYTFIQLPIGYCPSSSLVTLALVWNNLL